jgi:hypothetical protein
MAQIKQKLMYFQIPPNYPRNTVAKLNVLRNSAIHMRANSEP